MIWRVLRLLAVIALLALVWRFADGPAALARLRQADWRWLLAATVVVNLQTVLCARRWQVTAAALGQRISSAQAVGEYYLAQLINQTVPGGVLGDVGRAVRARHSADLVRSGHAVIVERLAGQIALAAVLLPALVVTGYGILALAILGAGVAVAVMARAVPRLRALAAPLLRGLAAPDVRVWQIGLGFAIVASNLAAFAFCARAIGTGLPMGAVVTLVPLILSAMLVPFGIGGWGWREGAAAALFPLAGASSEAGLAASAAFGAVVLASALPGLGWLMWRQAATRPV